MRKTLFIAACLLACVSSADAQGMTPNYIYAQNVLWEGSNGNINAVQIQEGVSGFTNCGDACPNGVTHTGYSAVQIGASSSNCQSSPVAPTTTITLSCSLPGYLPIPFHGMPAWSDAYIQCTQVGRISQDPSGVVSGYFETQITFVQGKAHTIAVTNACTLSGDSHPDWLGPTQNPQGIQLQNYAYQMMQLAWSSATPSATYSAYPFEPVSGYSTLWGRWLTTGGSNAPLPQQCTQNKPGYTLYAPGWLPPPQ